MKTSISCIVLLAMFSAEAALFEDCTEEKVCDEWDKRMYETRRCYKVERPNLPRGLFNGFYKPFDSECEMKIHQCEDKEINPELPSNYRRVDDKDISCTPGSGQMLIDGFKNIGVDVEKYPKVFDYFKNDNHLGGHN